MMPGGEPEAYTHLQPIVEKVAAQTDDGPCVTYIGKGGSGNYVKMVHNGIEYGDMQLIAEAYDVLRVVGGLTNEELAAVFDEWNKVCEGDDGWGRCPRCGLGGCSEVAGPGRRGQACWPWGRLRTACDSCLPCMDPAPWGPAALLSPFSLVLTPLRRPLPTPPTTAPVRAGVVPGGDHGLHLQEEGRARGGLAH